MRGSARNPSRILYHSDTFIFLSLTVMGRVAALWAALVLIFLTTVLGLELETPQALGQRSNVASVFAVTLTSSLELPHYKPLV